MIINSSKKRSLEEKCINVSITTDDIVLVLIGGINVSITTHSIVLVLIVGIEILSKKGSMRKIEIPKKKKFIVKFP